MENLTFTADESPAMMRKALRKSEIKWQAAFAGMGILPRNPQTGKVEITREPDREVDDGRRSKTREIRAAASAAMAQGDKAIAQMIRAGKSTAEIRELMHCGWARVARVACMHGLSIRRGEAGKVVPQEHLDLLRSLADQGMSAPEIRKVTGWGSATIYSRAASAGIRIRVKNHES